MMPFLFWSGGKTTQRNNAATTMQKYSIIFPTDLTQEMHCNMKYVEL